MNKDKYVFAQLVEFLDCFKFRRIVAKYNGDRYVKHQTYWNLSLAMMFGQLSNRESLRDLIVALDAHRSNVTTWDWARTYRNHHSHEQIKIGIIASLRSSLTDKTRLKDLFTKLNFNMTKNLPTLMGKIYLMFNQSQIFMGH